MSEIKDWSGNHTINDFPYKGREITKSRWYYSKKIYVLFFLVVYHLFALPLAGWA